MARGTGASGGKKIPTAIGSAATVTSKKSPLRLVEGALVPWERKTGFTGEVVEISERIPELVTLVRTIDGNNEAKAALAEFLRALERAGVVPILSSKSDEK